jgi:hypothetical protein
MAIRGRAPYLSKGKGKIKVPPYHYQRIIKDTCIRQFLPERDSIRVRTINVNCQEEKITVFMFQF